MNPTRGNKLSHALLVVFYSDSTPISYRRYCSGPQSVNYIDLGTFINAKFAGNWENAIIEAPLLRSAVLENDFLPRSLILPELSITISKSETQGLEAWLYAHKMTVGAWETVTVEAYYKPSTSSLTASMLVFKGQLSGDSVVTDAANINITAKSLLAKISQKFPRRTFADLVVEENEPDKSVNDSPLPICFGTWTDAESAYQLPMRLTETRHGMNLMGQLCDPLMWGVGGVSGSCHWVDSSGKNRIVDINATNLPSKTKYNFNVSNSAVIAIGDGKGNRTGAVIALDSGLYNLSINESNEAGPNGEPILQEGDYLLPELAVGLMTFNQAVDPEVDPPINDVLEHPVMIILTLLYCCLGVPYESIDMDGSFTDVMTESGDLRYRCYIDQETTVDEALSSLLRDFGYLLTFDDGLYHLVKNNFVASITTDEQAAAFLLSSSRAGYSDKFNIMPDFADYYGIKFSYKRNPLKDCYEKTITVEREGTTQAVRDGGRLLELESQWIWRDADAQASINHLVQQLLVSKPRALEVDIPHGLTLTNESIIKIDGGQYDGEYYWITALERDYKNSVAGSIQALFIDVGFSYGRWVVDDAPDYDDATKGQRLTSGFWCETLSNAAAYYSRWGGAAITTADQGDYTDSNGQKFTTAGATGYPTSGWDRTEAAYHNHQKVANAFLVDTLVSAMPGVDEPGPRGGEYEGTVPINGRHEGCIVIPFWRDIENGAGNKITLLDLADYADTIDPLFTDPVNRIIEVSIICQPVASLAGGAAFPTGSGDPRDYEKHVIGWLNGGLSIVIPFTADGDNPSITIAPYITTITAEFTKATNDYAWIAGTITLYQELTSDLG